MTDEPTEVDVTATCPARHYVHPPHAGPLPDGTTASCDGTVFVDRDALRAAFAAHRDGRLARRVRDELAEELP